MKQLLDVLIAIGGYRSTSMAINSAGVQLDPTTVRPPTCCVMKGAIAETPCS
jgi:hypothetical protein